MGYIGARGDDDAAFSRTLFFFKGKLFKLSIWKKNLEGKNRFMSK